MGRSGAGGFSPPPILNYLLYLVCRHWFELKKYVIAVAVLPALYRKTPLRIRIVVRHVRASGDMIAPLAEVISEIPALRSFRLQDKAQFRPLRPPHAQTRTLAQPDVLHGGSRLPYALRLLPGRLLQGHTGLEAVLAGERNPVSLRREGAVLLVALVCRRRPPRWRGSLPPPPPCSGCGSRGIWGRPPLIDTLYLPPSSNSRWIVLISLIVSIVIR